MANGEAESLTEGIGIFRRGRGKLEELIQDYSSRLNSKEQRVRSLATIVMTTPLGVAADLYVAHLSIPASIVSKLVGGVLYYKFGGAGASMGRDRLTKDSVEWKRVAQDSVYWLGFNSTGSIGYFSYDALSYVYKKFVRKPLELINLKGIGIATAAQTGVSAINGIFMGLGEDAALDLTGYKECNRLLYPKSIKNLTQKGKRKVINLAVATSTALTIGIYANYARTHNHDETAAIPQTEQTETIMQKYQHNAPQIYFAEAVDSEKENYLEKK